MTAWYVWPAPFPTSAEDPMQEAETPTPETGTPEPGAPEPRVLDPKEVAQYRPIPNARRALAAMVIRPSAVGLIGLGSTMLLLVVQAGWGWLAAIPTAVLSACLCAIIAWAISERHDELLERYRRRNILGYTGMFWFEGGTLRFRPYKNEKGWDGWTPRPDPVRAIGPCPKCPPWKDEHRERFARPYAMIPLGGRRSSFKNVDYDGGVHVVGTLGSCGCHWKIGFVGLSPDGNDLLVTVTDPTGARIQCPLRQAFTILITADQMTPRVAFGCGIGALLSIALLGSPKPVTIGDIIAAMDLALREFMAEHDTTANGATRRQGAGSAPPS